MVLKIAGVVAAMALGLSTVAVQNQSPISSDVAANVRGGQSGGPDGTVYLDGWCMGFAHGCNGTVCPQEAGCPPHYQKVNNAPYYCDFAPAGTGPCITNSSVICRKVIQCFMITGVGCASGGWMDTEYGSTGCDDSTGSYGF